MPRCSVSSFAATLVLAGAALAIPAAASRLEPGLPGHPSVTDYARCTVRSFLVTPKPPAVRRPLPRGIEAANGPVVAPAAARSAGAHKGRG